MSASVLFLTDYIVKVFRVAGTLLLLAFLTIGSVSSMAAGNAARVSELLSQMSQSLREKDYRGLFTYEFGGALQTLRVTHRVVDGIEYESLEYLNGPSRRVERNGMSVDCLSPADQVLRGLLPSLDGSFNGLTQHYHFYIRADERVAGRLATVLQIVPRDEYRYGFTLSIDRETFLPLGVMTLDTNRRVLERLQFASLELEADDSWVAPVETASQVSRPQWPTCDKMKALASPAWAVDWIPSGFMSAGASREPDVGDVMLFTDGLSAFSVFVRPLERSVAAQGKAQRGATVAFMQQQLFETVPHIITIVGEIPARTAQRIAGSVKSIVQAPEGDVRE